MGLKGLLSTPCILGRSLLRTTDACRSSLMRCRLLPPLIAAIALALLGLSAGVLAADAATTPTASPNYEYDHLAAFAQGSDRSPPRPAVSPASLTARAEGALAPVGFAPRAGVAAKAGTGAVETTGQSRGSRLVSWL